MDIFDFFEKNVYNNNTDSSYTPDDVTKLNNYWNYYEDAKYEYEAAKDSYDELLQQIKDNGYKVLRNENGKHKIIRGE